jgi:hypothetical protein
MENVKKVTTNFQRGAIVAACAVALLCGSGAAFAQQLAPQSQDQQAQDQQTPQANAPQDQPQAAPQNGSDPNMQQDQGAPPQTEQQQDQNAAPPPPPSDDPNAAPNGPMNGPANAPMNGPATNSNGQPNYAPRQYSTTRVPVPDPLTIPAGTVIQIRTTDWLSSDKNHKGDQFIGTLASPLIVNGWVIARRGQTITGQVTDAQRAGRVKGVSRLQLDLNQLTLVDGQLLNVQTTLLNASAGTSNGRDAAAVGVTTGTGAAIGAAAGGGAGAGIGAGAGLVAGLAGVLLTRGKPTIIPPEDVLTFRLEQPITFTTVHGPFAFRQATQQDYQTPRPPALRQAYRPYPYGYPPPPYGYPCCAYGYGQGYYPPPVGIGYYGGYYRRGWGWGW